MGHPRVPIDPVADLSMRLARDDTGTALNRVRACVRTWWNDHGLAEVPATVGKRIAVALIELPGRPEKLGGILVLQDLGAQLRAADLPAFARLFGAGHLADGQLVDWFIMRVLVTLLDRVPGRREVVRALVAWRGSELAWQRRAACLAFVKIAAQGDDALPGLVEQVLGICSAVVWSPERHDQTAVGAVLRELWRSDPARAEAFFRRHALLMSKDCARNAVSNLAPGLRAELLAHHRRATSLR